MQAIRKKPNWLKRNKDNLAKYTTILINICFVVGISIGILVSAVNPLIGIVSLPSLLTVIFQTVLKTQPSKLENMKKLLMEKIKDENDKSIVEKTYKDVLCQYNESLNGNSQQNTARSVEATHEPINEDVNNTPLPSARLPVKVVYNPKLQKYEFEVYQ